MIREQDKVGTCRRCRSKGTMAKDEDSTGMLLVEMAPAQIWVPSPAGSLLLTLPAPKVLLWLAHHQGGTLRGRRLAVLFLRLPPSPRESQMLRRPPLLSSVAGPVTWGNLQHVHLKAGISLE